MARSPKRQKARQWKDIDIDFTLKRVFRKDAFRPLQRDIITAAIDGDDIFVQAATSFGKSLCFQLPAQCSKGVTVVVSPLLALVKNQVDAANHVGVPAEAITSNTERSRRRAIEADLQCGHPRTRLLYVTPELCMTESFRKVLRQVHRNGQLIRIAIDEAHCISEWGHDFRTAYKELSWFKETLQCPSPPIMALTATATPKVREDVYKFLKLDPEKTQFFSTSTARPNIHYEVQYFSETCPTSEQGDDALAYLFSHLTAIHQRRVRANIPGPIHGIVYVPLRATAEHLAKKLSSQDIRAQAYHAGLEPHARASVQASFLTTAPPLHAASTSLQSSFNIIVATTAFGMGIDMPSVRFVIHYGLPRALESFVQESGRAGRDGKAAQSLLLYTREERDRTLWRVGQDVLREKQKKGLAQNPQADTKMTSVQAMVQYCENTDHCRHRMLGEYFRPPNVVNQSGTVIQAGCDLACDICKNGPMTIRRRKEQGLATNQQAMEYTQREHIEYE